MVSLKNCESKKLGIIIPTKNRSNYLIRQLYYYAKTNCQYPIYIGDSSNDEHLERVLNAVDKLKDHISIIHAVYPETNASAAMLKLTKSVKEKYVVFTGDDDFLIPNSLTNTFLRNRI